MRRASLRKRGRGSHRGTRGQQQLVVVNDRGLDVGGPEETLDDLCRSVIRDGYLHERNLVGHEYAKPSVILTV